MAPTTTPRGRSAADSRIGRSRRTLSSPISTPNSVLVGASPGGIAALARDTGEVRWQNATYAVDSNLAATDDAVYALASDGIFEATPR